MKKFFIVILILFSVNCLQAQMTQLSNFLKILEQNLIQLNKVLNDYSKILPKLTGEDKRKEEERKRKEQEELERKRREQQEKEQKEREKQEVLERKLEEERKRKEKEKKEPLEAKEFLNAIKTQAYPEIQNIEKTDVLAKDKAIKEFVTRINEYLNKQMTLNEIISKYHENLMQLKDDIGFQNYRTQYRHFSQLVISNIANQFDDDSNYKGYLDTNNKISADTMSIFRNLIEMNKTLLDEYSNQELQNFINRYDKLQNLYELSIGLPPTVSPKNSIQLKAIIENLEKELDQAEKDFNTLTNAQKQEVLEKIQLYQKLNRRILQQTKAEYRNLFTKMCDDIKCQLTLEEYDFKVIQKYCFKELKNLNHLQRQFSLRPESFSDKRKKEIQEQIEEFVQKCTPSKLIKEFYQELSKEQIAPEEESEEEPEATKEQEDRFEKLERELLDEVKKKKAYAASEKANLIKKIKEYKELAYQVDEQIKKAIISFETQLRLQK